MVAAGGGPQLRVASLLAAALLALLALQPPPGSVAGASLAESVIWAVNAGGEAHVDVHGIHFRKDPLEGRVGRGERAPLPQGEPPRAGLVYLTGGREGGCGGLGSRGCDVGPRHGAAMCRGSLSGPPVAADCGGAFGGQRRPGPREAWGGGSGSELDSAACRRGGLRVSAGAQRGEEGRWGGTVALGPRK